MIPFPDCIHVGDQFEWAPYGTPGWPHAWARIEVVDILRRRDGTVMIRTLSIEPEREDSAWNEERWFRQNVGNRAQPWRESAYPPSQITTDNPKIEGTDA